MRDLALAAEDEGCCTLDYGHDGVCAIVCPDCDGTTNCWVCDGYACGDDVTWCEGCDGTGGCFTCYEGVVADA